MKTITVERVECVLVRYSRSDDLRDMSQNDDPCEFCPMTRGTMGCHNTHCEGGYLVPAKLVPILRMRGASDADFY